MIYNRRAFEMKAKNENVCRRFCFELIPRREKYPIDLTKGVNSEQQWYYKYVTILASSSAALTASARKERNKRKQTLFDTYYKTLYYF